MALGIKMRSEATARRYFQHDEVLDRLDAMHNQEILRYSCMSQSPPEPGGEMDEATRKALSPECREKICEWSYRVVDHFGMDREVVLTAWNLIDRFLLGQPHCNTKIFKLISMTALYVSSKLYYGQVLNLSHLVQLSRSEFSERHIEHMELVMLRGLKWFVHPPTTKAVLREVLLLVDPMVSNSAWIQICEYTNFLSELSVYDKEVSTASTASIAFACLAASLDWIDDSEIGSERQELLAFVADCLKIEAVESCSDIERRLLGVYSNTEECMLSVAESESYEDEASKTKRQRLQGERSPVHVAELVSSIQMRNHPI